MLGARNDAQARKEDPMRTLLAARWIGGGVGFAAAGIERNATAGSASFYFTVSGYLVDLP
jgi:hypothetical protein